MTKKKAKPLRRFDTRPGALNFGAIDDKGRISPSFQRCLDGEAEEY